MAKVLTHRNHEIDDDVLKLLKYPLDKFQSVANVNTEDLTLIVGFRDKLDEFQFDNTLMAAELDRLKPLDALVQSDDNPHGCSLEEIVLRIIAETEQRIDKYEEDPSVTAVALRRKFVTMSNSLHSALNSFMEAQDFIRQLELGRSNDVRNK